MRKVYEKLSCQGTRVQEYNMMHYFGVQTQSMKAYKMLTE